MPAPGQGKPLAVALKAHALRFTKQRKANGDFTYHVSVRDARDLVDLELYLRGLREAAERAAPILREAGHSVGAADIIEMAGDLYAVRTHRTT